jgi:DNA-binding phage protein
MARDKAAILKCTSSYEDGSIEDLKDTVEAQNYLEAALEAYGEDANIGALLLALEHVTKAQGGLDVLAQKTKISYQHLNDILVSKQPPGLDNLLGIFAGLGFRLRLEHWEGVGEPSAVASVS